MASAHRQSPPIDRPTGSSCTESRPGCHRDHLTSAASSSAKPTGLRAASGAAGSNCPCIRLIARARIYLDDALRRLEADRPRSALSAALEPSIHPSRSSSKCSTRRLCANGLSRDYLIRLRVLVARFENFCDHSLRPRKQFVCCVPACCRWLESKRTAAVGRRTFACASDKCGWAIRRLRSARRFVQICRPALLSWGLGA